MTARPDGVQSVLRGLWRQSCSRTDTIAEPAAEPDLEPAFPAAGPGADVPPDGADDTQDRPETVRAHGQRFGETAMDCVSASIQADRAALVHKSADLFGHLFGIWAAMGLDPREVWVELHKREQLGTLLMQLNQAQSRLPRRVLKPWRVDSTKLP